MRNFIPIFIFLLLPVCVIAQPTLTAEEAHERLANASTDSARASAMNRLAIVFFDTSQLDSALIYVDKAIDFSERKGIDHEVGRGFLTKGSIFQVTGRNKEAKETFYQALATQLKIESEVGVMQATANLGLVATALADYDKAEQLLLQAFAIAENMNDTTHMSNGHNNLGRLYNAAGDYNKAIEHFHSALRLFEEIGHRQHYAGALLNIGEIHGKIGQLDEAEEYNTKALTIFNELELPMFATLCYYNLGDIAVKREQWNKALVLHQKSMEIDTEVGDLYGMLLNSVAIGEIYIEKGEYDKALEFLNQGQELQPRVGGSNETLAQLNIGFARVYTELEQYDKAEAYLSEIFEVAKEADMLENLHATVLELAGLNARKGNYAKAYQFLKQKVALGDSLLNIERIAKINELNTRYETEKKEQENLLLKEETARQKAEIRNKRITVWLVIALALLLLSSLIIFVIISRQRERAKLTRARIDESEKIRNEISTELHSGVAGALTGIIMKLENKNTDEKLNQEIDYLRKAARQVREKSHILAIPSFIQTTIADELRTLTSHFKTENIEIYMEANSADGWKSVATNLQQSIYRLIQELLSNTMKHSGAQHVDIIVEHSQKEIKLIYEDDGTGYNPEEITRNMGYKEVVLRYTTAHNAKLMDESREGDGCSINITFPL